MAARLTIERRFNGPPGSGHGGYTSGLVAAAAAGGATPLAGGAIPVRGDATVAVSLRVPPPLERALTVQPRHGGVAVLDGDTIVALGDPATVTFEPPPMPQPAPAAPDDPVYGELHEHPFPTCFGCGPAREPGDGLRIFATRVPAPPPARGGAPAPRSSAGGHTVAAWWTPDPSLGGDGAVAPEFVWAALDCPTGHACAIDRPAVLARLAVRRLAPVRIGEPHVVAAWTTGRDGRKHHAAGCLYAADGTPLALSEALWIELRDPAAMGAAGA